MENKKYNYNFTYEVTSNCNFDCYYCTSHHKEEFNSLDDIKKAVKFFDGVYETSTDINKMRVMLFGGECTLHPQINDILDLFSNSKFRVDMFSNFSADISVYEKFLNMSNSKQILLTYHPNHISIIKFKQKLDYLIKNIHKNYNICIDYGYYNGRRTINEIKELFNEYIKKYDNICLSFYPLIINNISAIVPDNIDNNNVEINFTDKNTKINNFVNCLIYNSYIDSRGFLYRCYRQLNKPLLNISGKNSISLYNKLKYNTFICKEKYCYKMAEVKNKD